MTHTDNFYKTLTSVRKQWKCNNSNCEETITKCRNSMCETVKYQFESENYQPEVSKIESLSVHRGVLNFPQLTEHNATLLDFSNNSSLTSGLITAVLNIDRSVLYWSNSKHVIKACRNKFCMTTTHSCENGKCTEMKITETF